MSSTTATLADRTILVTGGARRIGATIVRELAAAGSTLLLHYHRSHEEAVALAAEYGHNTIRLIKCDLTDPPALNSFVQQALELSDGKLDGIINNASLYPHSHLNTLSLSEFETSMRLHAYAPLVLARHLPRRSGHRADVINILDARITTYDHDHAAYHLAKRTLATLTSMLALELAPEIRVNAIAPGAVLQMDHETAADLQRLAAFNPLQTIGTPGGVAHCVRFLLENSFITGQTLFYDGGYHLKAATYG